MNTFLLVGINSLLAFVAILLLARWLNKEQLSHLTFYDWVVGITLGSIGANLATDMKGLAWHFLLALVIFAAAAWLTGYITEKSRPLRKIIEGEPTVIIHNGRILEHNMKKLRYNMDNLLNQLRGKDVFNIEDVEFAIIESNGDLSVLPKSQKRPVTPADLNIPTQYEGVASEIIMDGKIIYGNLQQTGLDEQWLITEIRKQGYRSPEDIVFASLNSNGTLYIDGRDDNSAHMLDVSD